MTDPDGAVETWNFASRADRWDGPLGFLSDATRLAVQPNQAAAIAAAFYFYGSACPVASEQPTAVALRERLKPTGPRSGRFDGPVWWDAFELIVGIRNFSPKFLSAF